MHTPSTNAVFIAAIPPFYVNDDPYIDSLIIAYPYRHVNKNGGIFEISFNRKAESAV